MVSILNLVLNLSVLLLGSLVAGAWIFNQSLLKNLNFDFTTMVSNTAMTFVLASLALLSSSLRPPLAKFIQLSVGIFIILFSLIIVSQDVSGYNFGIDQWLAHVRIEDDNPNPGRMAPLTCICFFLSGSLVTCLPIKRGVALNILFQVIALSVLVLAVCGVLAASVRIDLLYDWYQYGRMSLATAIGFIMLSLSLWMTWYQRESADNGYLNLDEKRIGVTAIIIVALVALTSGLSSFGILAHQMEQTLESGLRETNYNHGKLVEDSIAAGVAATEPLTTRILLNRSLNDLKKYPNDATAKDIIRQDAESFLGTNFTAIAIYAADESLVTEVGTFTKDAPLTFKLNWSKPGQTATLLWKDQALLQTTIDIVANGQFLGRVVTERSLPRISSFLFEKDLLGETAETRICFAVSDTKMSCLPSWRRTNMVINSDRVHDGIRTSMDMALHGENGLRISRDYLKRQIIAAYGPVGNLGLAMVVKIDTAEFYGPLRDKLHYIMLALILLCAFGVLLQRIQLLPLVRKLTRSEETFRSAMENASIGMAIIDPEGQWIEVNTALCIILGYTRYELLKTDFQTVTHADDLDGNLDKFQKIKDNKSQTYRAEKRYIHKDGHIIWALLNLSVVRNLDGSANHFIAHIQDITAQREIDHMKNDFISTVSHELRTPLTSIRGSLGLIEGTMANQLPPVAANLIGIAHKNSERLILLINDMLDIDKIAAGQMRFEMKPEKVAALVTAAVDMNRSYAQKFNATIQVAPISPDSTIEVDANRFIQALSNLLSNAAKFSKKDTIIQVFTEIRGHDVRICVADNGPGIPDEFLPRIFSKFSQADSSSQRPQGGTGLGLHITKQIVEHMNGTINFETKKEKGTIFWLQFRDIGISYGASRNNSRLEKSRILICEDDADIMTIMQMQLANAGFETDVAPSVAEAREKLKAGHFDAMVLDLTFPKESGLDFIRELRGSHSTINLPIVVVSATADEGKKVLNGDAIGVVDWLTKPIDEKKLIAALQRASKKIEGHRMQNVLHIEDDEDLSKMLALALQTKAVLTNVCTLKDAKARLAQEDFTLIILDVGLPDGNGLALLSDLHNYMKKPIPVLILSAHEVTQEVQRNVAGAMVKSRMSEKKIVETVLYLLEANSEPPHGVQA